MDKDKDKEKENNQSKRPRLSLGGRLKAAATTGAGGLSSSQRGSAVAPAVPAPPHGPEGLLPPLQLPLQ